MSFRDFITSLLKRGNLGNTHLNLFTDDEAMKVFELAFVHSSVDLINNYQLLELVGDTIVNASVIMYLREWNPKIISVKYLTRLKHNIISKKELALLAEKSGFWNNIKMNTETRDRFASMTLEQKHDSDDYLSLLEDTFEAFIGAVNQIVDQKKKKDGLGFSVCYAIIKSFLNETVISLEYDKIFDSKTIFKELCDKKGWDFKTCFESREDHRVDDAPKSFTVKCFGYPFGDQTKNPANRELLAVVSGHIKMRTENKCAEEALMVLKRKYGIELIPPNPYERVNK